MLAGQAPYPATVDRIETTVGGRAVTELDVSASDESYLEYVLPAASDVVYFVATQDVGTRVVVGFVRQGREQAVPLSLDELPSPDLRDQTTTNGSSTRPGP